LANDVVHFFFVDGFYIVKGESDSACGYSLGYREIPLAVTKRPEYRLEVDRGKIVAAADASYFQFMDYPLPVFRSLIARETDDVDKIAHLHTVRHAGHCHLKLSSYYHHC
jgi:hypothetical protein